MLCWDRFHVALNRYCNIVTECKRCFKTRYRDSNTVILKHGTLACVYILSCP